MAKKVITSFVDDIDGTEAEGTVIFSYDSKLYEIDLSAENKKKLEDALQPFIKAGRSAVASRRSSSSAKSNSNDLAAIRKWAKDNDIDVNERGRISAEVRSAYEAAH